MNSSGPWALFGGPEHGARAWVKLLLTVVQKYPLTGSLLEGGKLDGAVAFPGQIGKYFTNWRVGFPTTVEDKPVWAVQANGSNSDYRPVAGVMMPFQFTYN